jgi:hypothetical protein
VLSAAMVHSWLAVALQPATWTGVPLAVAELRTSMHSRADTPETAGPVRGCAGGVVAPGQEGGAWDGAEAQVLSGVAARA